MIRYCVTAPNSDTPPVPTMYPLSTLTARPAAASISSRRSPWSRWRTVPPEAPPVEQEVEAQQPRQQQDDPEGGDPGHEARNPGGDTLAGALDHGDERTDRAADGVACLLCSGRGRRGDRRTLVDQRDGRQDHDHDDGKEHARGRDGRRRSAPPPASDERPNERPEGRRENHRRGRSTRRRSG